MLGKLGLGKAKAAAAPPNAAPKKKAAAAPKRAAAPAGAAKPAPKLASSKMAVKRLRREYKMVLKSPPEFIHVTPLMENVFEWHYCIEAPPGELYSGGFYWGKLRFPGDYPWKPPSIRMMTPNGRFKTDYRLCLSMSDYHPETWSPSWTVSAVLIGLLSFMLGTDKTLGSIDTSDAFKRDAARNSMRHNIQQPQFREVFPLLVDRFASIAAELGVLTPAQEEAAESAAASATGGGSAPRGAPPRGAPPRGAPPQGGGAALPPPGPSALPPGRFRRRNSGVRREDRALTGSAAPG